MKCHFLKKLPFAFLFFLGFQVCFSQSYEIVRADVRTNIAPAVGIIEDKTNALTFEEAQKQSFKVPHRNLVSIPFSDATYWLKVQLKNSHPTQEQWILEWDNSLGEHVDFYAPDETGKYHTTKMGALSDEKFRYFEFFPVITLSLKKNQSKSIYIKIRSDRGISSTLSLASPQVYERQFTQNLFVQGILMGIVFIRLFYILYISFFAVKESAFRKYSILQVARSIGFLGVNSFLGGIFFQNVYTANLLNYLSQQIIPLFIVLLVRAIIPIHKLHPIVNYILHAIVVITALVAVALMIDYQWVWMLWGVYSFVFTQFFILVLFSYAFYKKIVTDINYSIPFLLSVFSYFFVHLRMIGLIDALWVIPVAYFFFVAELFVFGFFLGRIIVKYEKSRTLSEKQLILNQERTQQLRELDTMKTNFFTNISHEFRTPLTLILSPLEDLKKEFPTREIFQIMYRNAERLLSLINQLLDLSKLEANQMAIESEKVELVGFFNVLVSSFASLAQSNQIELVIQQDRKVCWAMMDKDKIEKIVTNLLSNALKFTEKSKQVSVLIHYTDQAIVLQIQDQGIGISPETLPKIFDRFYQVEESKSRRFEGTGIGLSLVKELVKVLDGEIEVQSSENLGTTFKVKLPLHEIIESPPISAPPTITPPLLPKEPNSHPNTPSATKEKILLIVDDNTDIRKYVKTIFEKDFQVMEAINGQAGLLQASEQIPDIIISDLMMPEMDGFTFCKHLKSDQKTSHIPVVMLTAKATVESRIEGFELGADDYLIKPFNTTEIQVRVKNLLEKQERLKHYFGHNLLHIEKNTPKVNPLEVAFLEKAKSIIEAHLGESTFNAEQFSQAMNLSQSQLLRKLKALTNLTIVEYIRQYRLQHAAKLLAERQETVAEIALQVGFENMSYFAKVFQDQFGVLPSDYRG